MSPGDNNAVSWPSEGSSLVPRHPWILTVGPFTLQHKPGQCIAGLWARLGTDCCTCMYDLNWTSFLFQTHLPVTAILPDHGSCAADSVQSDTSCASILRQPCINTVSCTQPRIFSGCKNGPRVTIPAYIICGLQYHYQWSNNSNKILNFTLMNINF